MTKFLATGCLVLLALVSARAQDPACASKVKADIYFLSDSSNSIVSIGWNRSLNFVVNFSRAFSLGSDNVQFAFGIFSTQFNHLIDLAQYTDRVGFEQAVLTTVQQKQNTYTYAALNAIDEQGLLTSPDNGARPDVPKVLIIVTDGQSQNVTRTIAAAEKIRNQGVTIIAIGVGVTNKVELLGMAGNQSNVFTVRGFNYLEAIRSQITQRVCEAKPPPQTVKQCRPDQEFDIYAVIDSSGSIGRENYKHNGEFLKRVISLFGVGDGKVKLALCIYGTSVKEQWILSSNKTFLEERLDNLPYSGSTTSTHLGLLWVVRSHVSSVEKGARPNAKQVVVVVTDGRSSRPAQTLVAAEELKAKGFIVVVFGIGHSVDVQEITSIASKPEYAVRVGNYESLDYFSSQVVDIVCSEEAS